jgi:hypothetical protein
MTEKQALHTLTGADARNEIMSILLNIANPVIEYVGPNPHPEGTRAYARDEVIRACHGQHFLEYVKTAEMSGHFEASKPAASLVRAIEKGVVKLQVDAKVMREAEIAARRQAVTEIVAKSDQAKPTRRGHKRS